MIVLDRRKPYRRQMGHPVSTEADNAITQPLMEEGFHVYVPEFLLVGILTQRMEWDTTPHRLDRN